MDLLESEYAIADGADRIFNAVHKILFHVKKAIRSHIYREKNTDDRTLRILLFVRDIKIPQIMKNI